MGWKTNSQARLAKHYEKVLDMMEGLSKLVEGRENLFCVEGLKEKD
jgi:hypothetical protein